MADMQIVPAPGPLMLQNIVEAQYVEMMVPLYSYGCEKKVKKALAHLKGIYSVNMDFHQQKVTVWGICNKYDVLTTVREKRKGARFWNSEDNAQLESSSRSAPSSPSKYPKRRPAIPPLTIVQGRSLSWKSWKKIFVRSYSF